MSKKKKIKVEDNERLKWEDLADTSLALRQSLGEINASIMKLSENLKDVIDSNPDVQQVYNGVVKSLEDLVNKWVELKKLHSTEKDGKYYYWMGELDINNDKMVDHYMNLSLAYGGLTNEVVTLANTSIAALAAEIEKHMDTGEKDGE